MNEIARLRHDAAALLLRGDGPAVPRQLLVRADDLHQKHLDALTIGFVDGGFHMPPVFKWLVFGMVLVILTLQIAHAQGTPLRRDARGAGQRPAITRVVKTAGQRIAWS